MNNKMTKAKIDARKSKMMRFNPEISKADASSGEKKAIELTKSILKGSGLDENDLIVLYSYIFEDGKAQNTFEVVVTNKDKTKEINDYLRKEQRAFESKGINLFAMPFYETKANQNGLASKLLEEVSKCNEIGYGGFSDAQAGYDAMSPQDDDHNEQGMYTATMHLMFDMVKLKKEMRGSLELKEYKHALLAPPSRDKAEDVEVRLTELLAEYIQNVKALDDLQMEEIFAKDVGDVFTGDRVVHYIDFTSPGDNNGAFTSEKDIIKALRPIDAKIKDYKESDFNANGTY